MDTHSVLITDGDLRITLPVLVSLGKRGIETVVAAEHKTALSFFSKYCKRKVLYPSPKEKRSQFVKIIKKIVMRVNFDVLFPISEWALIPISEYRNQLAPHIKLPFPSHETVKNAFDKSLSLKLAIGEGVPIPKTFFINNIQQLEEASKKVTYPAVIKPRWSWIWQGDQALFKRPTYVNSVAELLSAYKTIHNNFPFPLIQEYVPGKDYHIAALYRDSRPKAICGIKSERETPVMGGNSTFRESVNLNPEIKKYALRLLDALNWHGIAQVEFKLDPRDSVPKFMEINARFWGSLEVAIASGVDFPYLLYRLAVDEDVQPVFNYKVGVKRRWLEGDVAHLISVLWNVEANRGIQFPNKWRTLINFLKFYERGMSYDCFSWEDPLPFFSIIYRHFKERITSQFERMRAHTSI